MTCIKLRFRLCLLSVDTTACLWKNIEEMGRRIPRSRVNVCDHGSHLAMWDDEKAYFDAVLRFVKDVEAGRF
jgi:pimeloyl-ACP methyl ester carboxylesterase